MKNVYAIFLVIGLWWSGLCRGQTTNETPQPLTLADCVTLGLSRANSLANALRDTQGAEARITEVKAQLYPSLDISSSYTRLDEAPVFGTMPFGLEDNYNATASLGQLLYSGGSVRAALSAAKSYRNLTNEEVTRLQMLLTREITKAFYDVLLAQKELEVRKESLDLLREFEEQSQLKYELKAVSEYDLLSARVKRANEEPKLVISQNNLDLARTALANFLYLDSDQLRVQGQLEIEPQDRKLDNLYTQALDHRPELKQSFARVELTSADLRVEKSDYYPELRAFYQYAGTNPDPALLTEDEWGWHWSAGVTLSWSLFDGGNRKSRILQKRLARDNALADLDDLQRDILLEVKNAYLSLGHARSVLNSTAENVDLAQKALAIAEVRHERGLITFLELSDSNLNLRDAQFNHYRALHAYQVSLANLDYASAATALEVQK